MHAWAQIKISFLKFLLKVQGCKLWKSNYSIISQKLTTTQYIVSITFKLHPRIPISIFNKFQCFRLISNWPLLKAMSCCSHCQNKFCQYTRYLFSNKSYLLTFLKISLGQLPNSIKNFKMHIYHGSILLNKPHFQKLLALKSEVI